MADNIYKTFRSASPKIANLNTLSKRFDEPTYFSFRLVFGQDRDHTYNKANYGALYDTMPHPLFDTFTDTVTTVNRATPLRFVPGIGGGLPRPNLITESLSYSAVEYLENANEPTRATMLREFIGKFNDLQLNFPYYFQSIDGVADLLKVDPTKGQRILNDKRLAITCLEGIDLRMSYLLNLYKKIAWDDVYQRWILPDMMRYFTLKIYLAEFRTFHLPQTSSSKISGYGNPQAARTVITSNPIVSAALQAREAIPLYLSVLDDVLPTWEIQCEMCEFDINDISFTHLDGLSVATSPNPGTVKFGIKVGNIKELQIYPVFQHKFLIDRKLNGINRSKDEISTSDDAGNKYLYPASLQIAQNRLPKGVDLGHVPGLPYNETTNSTKLFGQGDPGANKEWGTSDDDVKKIKPTQPETWVGNALNFGNSYAKNLLNKVVDKAKVTSIPGLGISFNEIKTAIQSKNIIAALGMIRKGVNEVVESYGNAPSSRLEQPIQTDSIMRSFLTELTKSEATDDDTKILQSTAQLALSEKGVWKKITDYSLATNLVGPGETNETKTIDKNLGKNIIPVEKSKATSGKIEVGKIFEAAPTSKATEK